MHRPKSDSHAIEFDHLRLKLLRSNFDTNPIMFKESPQADLPRAVHACSAILATLVSVLMTHQWYSISPNLEVGVVIVPIGDYQVRDIPSFFSLS